MGFCRENVGPVGLEERRESLVIYYTQPWDGGELVRMEVHLMDVADLRTALREVQEDREDPNGRPHDDRRAKAAEEEAQREAHAAAVVDAHEAARILRDQAANLGLDWTKLLDGDEA